MSKYPASPPLTATTLIPLAIGVCTVMASYARAGDASGVRAVHAPPEVESSHAPADDSATDLGGVYLGGQLGYLGGRTSTTPANPIARSAAPGYATLAGGVHIGYARLFDRNLLLGVESDVAVPYFDTNSDRLSSARTALGELDEKLDSLGSLRVRAGYTRLPCSIYGTGGFAWSLGHFVLNPDGQSLEHWRWRPGFGVGAGVELALSPRWVARLEYSYQHLERSSATFGPETTISSTLNLHSVTLGLSWGVSGNSKRSASGPAKADSGEVAAASEATQGMATAGAAAASEAAQGPATAASRTAPVGVATGQDEPAPTNPTGPREGGGAAGGSASARATSGREQGQASLVGDQLPQSPPTAPPGRWNIHGQTTFVGQGYPSFNSPYQGAQSLSGSSQFKNTVSATLFLGLRLGQSSELYFDPELMQGYGLSDTHGVAAFPNGEAQKSNFPIPRFDLARIYARYGFGLGGEQELVDDGPNQLPGARDVSRLTVTAGRVSVTDFFLQSTFAGEPRTGFLNWNVYGTGSYDWTMDLVSFTWGALAELQQAHWALRSGYFLLPSTSNTNTFDWRIPDHGQYLAEYERRFVLSGRPGKVLLFGWLAYGNIGSYADALAEPATTPNYPDITVTRGHDRDNYGFALSAEQAVSDAWGVFMRASYSPEKVESMGWTDCGEAIALGGTLRGNAWYRPQDSLGLAGLVEGLSPIAQRYFKAGGMGIVIGDGTLAYRPETVLESYYAFTVTGWPTATLDYQLVVNPGYNADRGPVSIFALRLHAGF